MSNQSKPVYLKLRDQIAAAIIDGRYQEEQMLPSVRALAAEQGANDDVQLPLVKRVELKPKSIVANIERQAGSHRMQPR